MNANVHQKHAARQDAPGGGPRKIVVLGSTGSIGENVLRVAAQMPERFQLVGLAAQRQAGRLFQQARQFGVKRLVIGESEAARAQMDHLPTGAVLGCGADALDELAAMPEADLVVAAIVGMAGLRPLLSALNRGVNVALASKEALVVAGTHVLAAREKSGSAIIPVDSEHSAIFQCLQGQHPSRVRRIILTASGGPFAQRPAVDFDKVSVEEVLKHPRWKMGRKVTVDSATMMNKGLEMMEAAWLFNVGLAQIDVLVHPESLVHSLVEFVDGALLAQISHSDMRFAIQYALTYPDRADGRLPALDLAETGQLHFFRPDEKRFPCLGLARAAAGAGGTMPAVMNAANEMAVQEFLQGRMVFSGIWDVVEKVMGRHGVLKSPSLQDIMLADRWARSEAKAIMAARQHRG